MHHPPMPYPPRPGASGGRSPRRWRSSPSAPQPVRETNAAPSAVSTGITKLTTSSTAAESGPITIMPLGDSLTAGDDPTRPTTSPQSYRGYLYNSLLAAGYDVDFVGSQQNEAISGGDPDHEGHGGYTIGPDNSTLCDGCGPANLDSGLEGLADGVHARHRVAHGRGQRSAPPIRSRQRSGSRWCSWRCRQEAGGAGEANPDDLARHGRDRGVLPAHELPRRSRSRQPRTVHRPERRRQETGRWQRSSGSVCADVRDLRRLLDRCPTPWGKPISCIRRRREQNVSPGCGWRSWSHCWTSATDHPVDPAAISRVGVGRVRPADHAVGRRRRER